MGRVRGQQNSRRGWGRLTLLAVVAGVALSGSCGVVDSHAADGAPGSIFGLPGTAAGEAGNLLANGSFVSSAAGWSGVAVVADTA